MPLLLLVLAAAELPTGHIAYLHGADPRTRSVHVLDLATGVSREIGRAQADGPPVWQPGGTWIAFESAAEDGAAVFIVQHDGAQSKMLPRAGRFNTMPAWSLDGTRIAYAAGEGLAQRIAVYDLESGKLAIWGGGADAEPADDAATRPYGLLQPQWLPQGSLARMIGPMQLPADAVIALTGDGNLEQDALLAIGITGEPGRATTDIIAVTRGGTLPLPQDIMPARGRYEEWSVNAHKLGLGIVFESNDGGDREILAVSWRGSFVLSNHRAADWNPVWGNRNRWVAFESMRGGECGVYRVHLETFRVFAVAAEPGSASWSPAWSPDDRWIAYVSDRSGSPELYCTNIADRSVVQLTDGGVNLAPAWRP